MKKVDLLFLKQKGLSYMNYRKLIDDLWKKGLSTDVAQEPAHTEYTKLNIQRMKRLDHTVQLLPTLISTIGSLDTQLGWMILTEGWCGDAAQNLPWMNKMVELSNGKIQAYYLLRDENLTIMDEFLTNGSRSIPKLVCFDFNSGEVLGTWGPRPNEIQVWYSDHKKSNPEIDKKERDTLLHQLYTSNKGEFIQDDFNNCIQNWVVLTAKKI